MYIQTTNIRQWITMLTKTISHKGISKMFMQHISGNTLYLSYMVMVLELNVSFKM